MEAIKVKVVDYGRTCLYLRYKDPLTNKLVAKSSGTANAKEAEREAGLWEKQLREGKYKPASKITWLEFRERFEGEAFRGYRETTQAKVFTTFKAIEEIINPAKLADITKERVAHLRNALFARGLSDMSVASYLAIVRLVLNWAKENEIVADVPKIVLPRRARGSKMMKGRPITTEEFERMVDAVPECVWERNVEKWQHLLRGLWASGLRLGEAVDLWWDRTDRMHVDLAGRYPVLRIHADQEKGGEDRMLPISPEFGKFLLETPEEDRTGRVFKLGRTAVTGISDQITQFGKKANVVVDVRSGKFASAHDLRRAFGERWARLVMPQVLMELMRHQDIKTTLRYYVGQNAQATAAHIWKLSAETEPAGNTFCNR